MHSDNPKHRPRRLNRGSVLLEALIAFALISAFALAAMQAVSGGLGSQRARADQYWLAEYARSKAEELAVGALPGRAEGTDDGKWVWQVAKSRVHPDGLSPFDQNIALDELTVTVWNADHPADRFTARTIVGRAP